MQETPVRFLGWGDLLEQGVIRSFFRQIMWVYTSGEGCVWWNLEFGISILCTQLSVDDAPLLPIFSLMQRRSLISAGFFFPVGYLLFMPQSL